MGLDNDNNSHGVPKLGVLLINLGTPDAPTTTALRRYLAEFLWDRRVVDVPRPIWWLILHGIILRFRPKRSAAAYRQVWTDEGSPLLSISRRQESLLRDHLTQAVNGPIEVALGMRYGNPSIASALEQLQRANVQRLLVMPLYPQYSCSTTASGFDAVAAALKRTRWIPEMRFINQYHDETGYIEALANSVEEHWRDHGRGEQLLLSFHGTPVRYLKEGDPYFCHCHKTARLLAERLGLDEGQWRITFQSRFGREPWLQPYTDKTLERLAAEGVHEVDVICPGFSADCLETLEEIAGENRERFIAAGGRELRYIPALNDRGDHIEALSALIQRHMVGWPETVPEYSLQQAQRSADERVARVEAVKRRESSWLE